MRGSLLVVRNTGLRCTHLGGTSPPERGSLCTSDVTSTSWQSELSHVWLTFRRMKYANRSLVQAADAGNWPRYLELETFDVETLCQKRNEVNMEATCIGYITGFQLVVEDVGYLNLNMVWFYLLVICRERLAYYNAACGHGESGDREKCSSDHSASRGAACSLWIFHRDPAVSHTGMQ